MEARDAHWFVGTASEVEAQPGASVPRETKPLSLFYFRTVVVGKPTARITQDGVKLCDFQRGTCTNKLQRANRAHRCAVVLRGERACGAPNHGATVGRSA